MKMLLWKEWGNARRFYAAAAVFVFLPYLLPLLGFGISHVGTISLYLSVLICAFIAGNAIAGERTDRSAEFIAYLPIRRLPAIVSKAIITAGLCLSFLLFNLVVVCLIQSGTGLDGFMILGILSESLFMFGLAWLASSLLKSSVIAAAAGLAMWSMVLIPTMVHSQELRSSIGAENSYWHHHFLLAVLTGMIAFLAGCVVYVRRPNP